MEACGIDLLYLTLYCKGQEDVKNVKAGRKIDSHRVEEKRTCIDWI